MADPQMKKHSAQALMYNRKGNPRRRLVLAGQEGLVRRGPGPGEGGPCASPGVSGAADGSRPGPAQRQVASRGGIQGQGPQPSPAIRQRDQWASSSAEGRPREPPLPDLGPHGVSHGGRAWQQPRPGLKLRCPGRPCEQGLSYPPATPDRTFPAAAALPSRRSRTRHQRFIRPIHRPQNKASIQWRLEERRRG